MNTGRIDAVLARGVATGAAPGIVAVVADAHEVVHLRAAGVHDAAAATPLEPRALFRVASFTKICVGIAVLRLVEERRLALETPVGDILPAFDRVQVVEPDGDGGVRLRPPRTRATLHHLLTHTSGLTYDVFDEALAQFGSESGVPMPSTGLRSSFGSPLVADPGTRFAYGMSTDWTGLVLEEVLARPLDRCLHDLVFAPLGLRDLTFAPDGEQRARLVPVHARARHGFDVLDFDYPVDPEFYSGGHGLYATAADFAAVQQLLLNRGELRGVRLLQPATVDLMTRDHLDGLPIERARSIRPQFSYDLDPGPGVTWGLETMITADSRPGRRPARSFGWCGTFNTFYWIDPVNELVAAIYMQTLPFLDPAAVELADAFEEAVYT